MLKTLLSCIALTFVAAIVAIDPCYSGGIDYPTQTVRIIVPFAPAAGTDVIARDVAQRFSEEWNGSVIVENRTGGNGDIGTSYVARARPDGHTLLVTTNALVINPQLYPTDVTFDPTKDFTPVSQLARLPFVLVVNPELPVKTFGELIEYARAHPGKINFGSSGAGGGAHLSGEMLKALLHLDMTHVPYKGASPALMDVIAGHIDFMFMSIIDFVPFAKTGKVRALAVTSKTRNPSRPEIPAVSEYPGLENFETDLWYGLLAPAKTDPAIIDKVYHSTVRALQDSKLKDQFEPYGVILVGNSPEEFAEIIKKDRGKWSQVIKAAGLAKVVR
jgi:tripartite-type tricarboxylate transporter receptor subunit TctC